MSEVVVVATMKAKDGHEEEVLEGLSRAAASTHEEPGCLLYAVHRASEDPTQCVLVERWRSREDLDEHFQKPYIRELGERAHLLAEPPKVLFLEGIAAGDPAKGLLSGG